MPLREAEAAPAILSVAFPYAVIGPRAVGGAEVVCSQIEAAMSSLGFRSVVVAHADSVPRGRLYGTRVPAGTITDELRAEVEAAHQVNIERALEDNSIGLVHMHGMDFHRYRISGTMPVLVTLHLPPSWYPEAIWDLPENYHLVCVSASQRRDCPERAQKRLTVVGNGVAMPPLRSLRTEGRYALMLSRICPEKNLHAGLDAARLAGLPVLLGGEVFPYAAHEQYFREEIEPRLTSVGEVHESHGRGRDGHSLARFLGPVTQAEKERVLSRAACLLLPSLAPETSSLVAMEALAAGVPVIGMAVGAVPEIIEHGRTGFLVAPDEAATQAMAEAIRRLPELSRAACRAAAEAQFPFERMLDGYSAMYRSLALPLESVKSRVSKVVSSAPEARFADVQRTSLAPSEVLVEELRSKEELARLEREWVALWEADSSATPFQHPGWLLPWWRQFGPEGELWALTLRLNTEGSLLGFVPLYLYRRPETSSLQLLLLGAGTTDYLDGVWGEHRQVLGVLAWQHVFNTGARWEECSLNQLRAESPLVRNAEFPGISLAEAEPTSVIDVGAELPTKIRANARRYRRRAEMRGQLEFHVAQTPQEALGMFDVLVALHSRRWEGRGTSGVLSDARVLAHHREAIPRLIHAGILRMFHMTLSGETLGVLYGLCDPEQRPDRRLYLYLIGFADRFAELSPGTLLLHEVWHYARENGVRKLDLLRGGEAYKVLWGATSERTFAAQCARKADRSLSWEASLSCAS